MSARVPAVEERQPIWDEQKALYPGFADYESHTDRCAVVMFDRR